MQLIGHALQVSLVVAALFALATVDRRGGHELLVTELGVCNASQAQEEVLGHGLEVGIPL